MSQKSRRTIEKVEALRRPDMTSPADKATDDVRGLVERLRAFADHLEPAEDMYGQEIADVRSAADLITSLLERAERVEDRIKAQEEDE